MTGLRVTVAKGQFAASSPYKKGPCVSPRAHNIHNTKLHGLALKWLQLSKPKKFSGE
eukprot:jgi/Botrbrau1/23645/Bobra.55_2s0031.1